MLFQKAQGHLDQQRQDGEPRSPSQTGEGWRPQYPLPDTGPVTLGVGGDLSTARNSAGLLGGGWSSTQGLQDLGCRRLIQTAVLVTDRTQNAKQTQLIPDKGVQTALGEGRHSHRWCWSSWTASHRPGLNLSLPEISLQCVTEGMHRTTRENLQGDADFLRS